MDGVDVSTDLARMEESLGAAGFGARVGIGLVVFGAQVALQLSVFDEPGVAVGLGAGVGLLLPVLELVSTQMLRREERRIAAGRSHWWGLAPVCESSCRFR